MSTLPSMTPSKRPGNGHFGWSVARENLVRHAPGQVLVLDACPGPTESLADPRVRLTRLGDGGPLLARATALPFEDRAFDLVIVREGLDDDDGVLEECLRLVARGGRLLVLAEGPWRFPPRRKLRRQSLASGPLLRLLESRGFVIEHSEGRGLAGTGFRSGEGWRRSLMTAADHWVLCARRHEGGAIIRPLKFAPPRALGAQGAALDGVNREAVA